MKWGPGSPKNVGDLGPSGSATSAFYRILLPSKACSKKLRLQLIIYMVGAFVGVALSCALFEKTHQG